MDIGFFSKKDEIYGVFQVFYETLKSRFVDTIDINTGNDPFLFTGPKRMNDFAVTMLRSAHPGGLNVADIFP